MAPGSRLQELTAKYMQNPRRFFVPLANEYRKGNDLDRAIALCREHLPSQPGHMSGHIVLGSAYFEKGDIAAAREVFMTSVALDDENLIALRHLGDIARTRNELPEARQWYARVLDADPRNGEIERILAELGTASESTDVADKAHAPVAGQHASEQSSESAAPFDDTTPPGLRAIISPAADTLGAGAGHSIGPRDLPDVPRAPFDRFDLSTLSQDSLPVGSPVEEIRVDDGVGFIFDDLDQLVDPATASGGSGLSLPSVDEADFSAGISTPTRPQIVPSELVLSQPALSEPIAFESSDSERVESVPVVSEAVTSEPAASATVPVEPAPDELLSRPGFGALASFASWRSAQERETPTQVPSLPTPAPVQSAPTTRAPAEPGGLFWESRTNDAASTAPEFVTETMAALYASQGFTQQAIDVYQALLTRSPADTTLVARIEELETRLHGAARDNSLRDDADKALQFDELDATDSSDGDAPSMLETMYDVSPPDTDDAFAIASDGGWNDPASTEDDWFANTAPDLSIGSGFAGDDLFGVSDEVFGQPVRPSGNADGASPRSPGETATLAAVFGAPSVSTADDVAADMLLALAAQMVGRLPKDAPTLPVPDILELPSAVPGDDATGTSPAPLLSFDRFFSGSGAPPRARIDTPSAARGVTPSLWPAPVPTPLPSLSPTFGGVPVIPPPTVTPATWAGFDQFVPPAAPASSADPEPPPTPVALPVALSTPAAMPPIDVLRFDTPPVVMAQPAAVRPVEVTPFVSPAASAATATVPAVPPVAPPPVAPAAAPDVEAEAAREAPSEFHRWLEGLT